MATAIFVTCTLFGITGVLKGCRNGIEPWQRFDDVGTGIWFGVCAWWIWHAPVWGAAS